MPLTSSWYRDMLKSDSSVQWIEESISQLSQQPLTSSLLWCFRTLCVCDRSPCPHRLVLGVRQACSPPGRYCVTAVYALHPCGKSALQVSLEVTTGVFLIVQLLPYILNTWLSFPVTILAVSAVIFQVIALLKSSVSETSLQK